MMITYSQRLLEALLNIDKYNNIVNNTKEYKLIEIKGKAHNSRSLSLSLSLSISLKIRNLFYNIFYGASSRKLVRGKTCRSTGTYYPDPEPSNR